MILRLRRVAALFLILSPWVLAQTASADLTARVRSLYEKGSFAEAAKVAAGADRPAADVLFYQGLSLARLGRQEEANAALLRGRRSYPHDPRFPLELAGLAYVRKQLPEAVSLLHGALHLDPASDYGNEFLGSIYLLQGNLAAALKYWNRTDKPLIQEVHLAPPPPLVTTLRERAITISGGQIFTLSRLRTTEENFDRLGVFSSRRFELVPRQDGRFDLTLRLSPVSPALSGKLGRLLPLLRGLPYQAIHFDRYNLAERAINLESLWRWDRNKRRISVELAGPIRLDPRRGYRLMVDARDETWDIRRTYHGPAEAPESLKVRRVEAGGDLVFTLTQKLDWTTGLRLALRQFRNGDGSPIFDGGWSFAQRNAFTYRLLDLPERRLRVNSSATLRTGRVFRTGASRYAIGEGDLSGSWFPQATGETWAVSFRLRGGKTFGMLPFDDYFQLGMERDNDLWLRGLTGTREGRKGSAPMGTDYALLQGGVQRTVVQIPFLRITAGPFFDAGVMRDSEGRFGSLGWRPATGIQANLIVSGGLTWSFVYGHDLRGGGPVFYTTVVR